MEKGRQGLGFAKNQGRAINGYWYDLVVACVHGEDNVSARGSCAITFHMNGRGNGRLYLQ